jgi:hypothetical protein
VNGCNREEEREMLPLCREKKIGVIPYSPLASGRLTRNWSSERTHRSENRLGNNQSTDALPLPMTNLVLKPSFSFRAVPRKWINMELSKPVTFCITAQK